MKRNIWVILYWNQYSSKRTFLFFNLLNCANVNFNHSFILQEQVYFESYCSIPSQYFLRHSKYMSLHIFNFLLWYLYACIKVKFFSLSIEPYILIIFFYPHRQKVFYFSGEHKRIFFLSHILQRPHLRSDQQER